MTKLDLVYPSISCNSQRGRVFERKDPHLKECPICSEANLIKIWIKGWDSPNLTQPTKSVKK
jgi:hypothetical protein